MSWAPLTASPSAALPEAIPIPVPVPVIPAQAQAGAAHRGSRRNRTPGRRSGAVEWHAFRPMRQRRGRARGPRLPTSDPRWQGGAGTGAKAGGASYWLERAPNQRPGGA